MNEIKVLIQGYAREINGGWIASSTATLVKSNGKNIIVDPGCNRKKLLGALKKEGLKTGDIDFVILTHSHTDHTLLCGIFEKAKVMNSQEIYYDDKQIAHNNIVPGTDTKILQTQGHSPEHCSLAVLTKKGIYVVAGDVFWWTDNEKQEIDAEKPDASRPADTQMKQLIESREKILEIANYVVPGHGKVFKVER